MKQHLKIIYLGDSIVNKDFIKAVVSIVLFAAIFPGRSFVGGMVEGLKMFVQINNRWYLSYTKEGAEAFNIIWNE